MASRASKVKAPTAKKTSATEKKTKEKPAKLEEVNENGGSEEEEVEPEPDPQLFHPEAWLSYGKVRTSSNANPDREIDSIDIVPINEGHKVVIRKTWQLMNNHLTESGTRIFIRIFEVNSKVKTVFGYSDADTTDVIVRCDRLRLHSKRFMQAVEYAVQNLDELNSSVAEVFVSLGKRHIHFKELEPDYFGTFSGAMMYVWRDDLGEHFTPEVRAAWSRLFDFLLQHLRHGLELELENAKNSK